MSINNYGGFIPKKAKTDKDKINLNPGHDLKRKRKVSEESKKSEKEKRRITNKNKYLEDKSEDTSNDINEINLGEIKEENNNEDIEMKDETEEKREPKKIKKIRKVKVTRQYMDEKGYLVTKDEEVEEEYWSDEKPEKKIVKNNFVRQDVKPNKNKKKAGKGQWTMDSFFKK